MNNNDIGRVVGGVFFALCNALSPEGVEIAYDTLRGFAADPELDLEVRRIFHCIAESYDDAEDEIEQAHPHLSVITGGAA